MRRRILLLVAALVAMGGGGLAGAGLAHASGCGAACGQQYSVGVNYRAFGGGGLNALGLGVVVPPMPIGPHGLPNPFVEASVAVRGGSVVVHAGAGNGDRTLVSITKSVGLPSPVIDTPPAVQKLESLLPPLPAVQRDHGGPPLPPLP